MIFSNSSLYCHEIPPMKKYIVLWVFGLVLPLVATAQVNHQLHFAYGFDQFRAPFLEPTPLNISPEFPIWVHRDYVELSWDVAFKGGFLLRQRFSLGFDRIPDRTWNHQNHFAPEAWGTDGGKTLILMEDFGYVHPLAKGKLRLTLGVGVGANMQVDGGSWVGPLQSMENGDPVDESYLISYDAMGALVQPFAGLRYSPMPHLWIGFEQRHQFSFQSVHLSVRHDFYNGQDFNLFEAESMVTDLSRSFQYQPPVVHIGWQFAERKTKSKKYKEAVYFGTPAK